jgi:hypothetical protein
MTWKKVLCQWNPPKPTYDETDIDEFETAIDGFATGTERVRER